MPKEKDNVAELIHNAQALLAQRHHQEARAIFLRVLELRPDLPDAHYGLATVCYHQGDVLGAAHHFKEVTRHDPLRAGAFINLGALYNHLGREDDAVIALRRGIQLDPHRSEGYYNLGLVYRRVGQLDLAAEAYREAVRLQPGMGEAHFNLANILLEVDKFAPAIAHYQSALKARPNWPEALQGLAIAKEALAEDAGPVPSSETVVESLHDSADRKALEQNRPLDPAVHGAMLAEIHQAVNEADAVSKKLGAEVAHQLDAAIKDLSNSLLRSDVPSHELTKHLESFERHAERFKNVHIELQRIQNKIEMSAEDLKKK